MAKVKPKKQFVTGSSLVIGVEPADRDIVCYFKTEEDLQAFLNQYSSDKELYGDSPFLTIRDGDINYICTRKLEFFYRFKAYSGVLHRLQLKDKADRVEVAKACLYYEPPKE